jgi:hypothetical protein
MGKLKFENPITWDYHRSGWKWVVANMQQRLGNPAGILIHTFLDDLFFKTGTFIQWQIKVPEEPFVAFLHGVPDVAPGTVGAWWQQAEGRPDCPDIRMSMNKWLASPHWSKYTEKCKGLFVLSQYSKRFLESRIAIPVEPLIHPTLMADKLFDWQKFTSNGEKKLLLVGVWQRQFQHIFDIKVRGYVKAILKGCEFNYEQLFTHGEVVGNPEIRWIQRLPDDQYDEFLTRNIVLLPLYDCSACNTLLECIVRHTPVLVPKVGGVPEYLGEDYPLYYSNLEEAAAKVMDHAVVRQAHEYLASLDKSKFQIDYFLESMENSPLYQSL